MKTTWKKIHLEKGNIVKYQQLGTGKYNVVFIGKNIQGWYVTRANPNNSISNYFKTKHKAFKFAERWMKTLDKRIAHLNGGMR